ncbi:MAG: hypothetical protein ACK58M_25765 [Acidobacteriota bacterium]
MRIRRGMSAGLGARENCGWGDRIAAPAGEGAIEHRTGERSWRWRELL